MLNLIPGRPLFSNMTYADRRVFIIMISLQSLRTLIRKVAKNESASLTKHTVESESLEYIFWRQDVDTPVTR
jgi:hypothetical protein